MNLSFRAFGSKASIFQLSYIDSKVYLIVEIAKAKFKVGLESSLSSLVP